MTQASWRGAKLTATFHEEGISGDCVQAYAQCGDLRIEIEVPYDEWPREDDGSWQGERLAKTAEVELT